MSGGNGPQKPGTQPGTQQPSNPKYPYLNYPGLQIPQTGNRFFDKLAPQLSKRLMLEGGPGPGRVAGVVPGLMPQFDPAQQFNMPQQLQLLALRQQMGQPGPAPLPFRAPLMPNSMRIFQPSQILRR